MPVISDDQSNQLQHFLRIHSLSINRMVDIDIGKLVSDLAGEWHQLQYPKLRFILQIIYVSSALESIQEQREKLIKRD